MTFSASLSVADHTAIIEMSGELDSASAPRLHQTIDQALQADVSRLELRAMALTYMSSAGLRALLFARQKMGEQGMVVLVGAPEPVTRTIYQAGLARSILMADI